MPVSSRTSRVAASIGVSPGSTCPLGSASTREPSAARRVGTIVTTSSSRTTTPPAENSRACALDGRLEFLAGLGAAFALGFLDREPFDGFLRGSEDILLQRPRVVDHQPPTS